MARVSKKIVEPVVHCEISGNGRTVIRSPLYPYNGDLRIANPIKVMPKLMGDFPSLRIVGRREEGIKYLAFASRVDCDRDRKKQMEDLNRVQEVFKEAFLPYLNISVVTDF